MIFSLYLCTRFESLSGKTAKEYFCYNRDLSKEIAGIMGISKNTVDRHRQNIIEKLQVSNTTEACFKAKKLGLIE